MRGQRGSVQFSSVQSTPTNGVGKAAVVNRKTIRMISEKLRGSPLLVYVNQSISFYVSGSSDHLLGHL